MTTSSRLVLHVHTLPVVSGSGLNTFLSMKHLDPCRFRPALACAPGGRLEELVRSAGFEFHPLQHLVAPISPFHDLAALRELTSLCRRLRPAIVHTHNSKAGFLGRLAAHLAKVRCVHTVHGFAFHDRESPLRRALFRTCERLAFPWADATVAISPQLADWGAREGIGQRESYEIAWSGIEIERFANADRSRGRSRLGLQNDEVAIGIVSKLWEGKGHEFLIEVMAPMLSDRVRLVFIGEGPLEERLRRRAAALGTAAPRVLFAGFFDDPAEVTAALDIAALPSEFEGMGRVLLEAQAAGVPVLANRIGGMADVVGGGMLLPPRDVEAWRTALSGFISDPEKRRSAGESGRRFVTDRFSAQVMTKTLEDIYERVLTDKADPAA